VAISFSFVAPCTRGSVNGKQINCNVLGSLDIEEISMTYYAAGERSLITVIHFIFAMLKEDS
jgi:hypothetical protein